MNYRLREELMDYPVEGSMISNFTMTNFNFGFGVTSLSGVNDKMTHDFFILFGIKNFNFTRYDLIDNVSVSGNYDDRLYRHGSGALQAKILPSVQMGYTFGFGF